MRRVMIVGIPGAGKSTLAAEIGKARGLPVFQMDLLVQPVPFQYRAADELNAAIAEVVAKDHVLDGGYAQTYAMRLAACDTLIWVDTNLLLCLFRAWRRIWVDRRRLRRQADLPIKKPSYRFLRMMLRLSGRWREELDALMAAAPASVRVIRLRSRREVRNFVQSLGAGSD